jgi:hypothetical protein
MDRPQPSMRRVLHQPRSQISIDRGLHAAGSFLQDFRTPSVPETLKDCCRSAFRCAYLESRHSNLVCVRSYPKRSLMTGTDMRRSHASRHWREESKIAQRGDDGIHREAGLQDGENPARDPKTYHSDT